MTALKATPTIDTAILRQATEALIKHHKSKNESSKSLLGDEEGIIVAFSLLKVPHSGQTNVKPIRISIPHALVDRSDVEVCLIVKQESKEWVEEMIDQYSEYMKCVKKVIGLDNLRKNYGRYEQRRELLSSYDLFLADDRIIPMLRSALGNKFIERKKFPVPLKLTRKEVLPLAVKRAVEATYMYQTRGTSMSVRAGNTGMPVDELVENFEAIVNGVAEKIPKKWKNILNISIKTSNSIALPFYSKRPDELAELEDIVEKAKEKKGKDGAVSKKRKGGEANEDDDVEISPAINVDKSSKSPLLRALKKQKSDGKKAEPKDKIDVDKSVKKEKQKKKLKESDVSDIVEKSRKGDSKNVATKNDSTPATKAKNKKRADSDVSEAENLSTRDSKKQKIPKTEEKKSKTKSKATPAKEEIDTTKPENKPADGDFVASKKFKGAKKGYVFKKGAKGVGYYKDTPPVADKAALDALARSASNGRGGRRQNTPKSSAKKRKGRR
mmetsp:Transcript_17583/g.27388  ORF Transcript_17583/g.27388 Transcript_17583/m.27388 type:complete len:497 (-) Transcript_17583:32-1522(-)